MLGKREKFPIRCLKLRLCIQQSIVLGPARKHYRIGFLLTHKNGFLGAISVMEESCTELMKKVECSVPRFDERKGIRTVAEVNK